MYKSFEVKNFRCFDELKIDKLDNGNEEEATSDVLADAFSDSPLSDSLDGFI